MWWNRKPSNAGLKNKNPKTKDPKGSQERTKNVTEPSKEPRWNPKPRSLLYNNHPKETRLEGLLANFELLSLREEGDLTLGLLNVKKIGRIKHEELAITLSNQGIDCLAVTEHHIAVSPNDPDPTSVKSDHRSLAIKGYMSASSHRDNQSGGVTLY